jgi:hypothetical protein
MAWSMTHRTIANTDKQAITISGTTAPSARTPLVPDLRNMAHRSIPQVGAGDAAGAFATRFKPSPPAAKTVISSASEQHEQHDDDQNGCHNCLQQSVGKSAWNSNPAGAADLSGYCHPLVP